MSQAAEVRTKPPIASPRMDRRGEKRFMEGSPEEGVEVKGVASIKSKTAVRL